MKGAIVNMFANEMVSNIYVFHTLVEFRRCGKSNCSGIVEKDPDGDLE